MNPYGIPHMYTQTTCTVCNYNVGMVCNGYAVFTVQYGRSKTKADMSVRVWRVWTMKGDGGRWRSWREMEGDGAVGERWMQIAELE